MSFNRELSEILEFKHIVLEFMRTDFHLISEKSNLIYKGMQIDSFKKILIAVVFLAVNRHYFDGEIARGFRILSEFSISFGIIAFFYFSYYMFFVPFMGNDRAVRARIYLSRIYFISLGSLLVYAFLQTSLLNDKLTSLFDSYIGFHSEFLVVIVAVILATLPILANTARRKAAVPRRKSGLIITVLINIVVTSTIIHFAITTEFFGAVTPGN